ncbi:xanthine dehydrogenase family protein subunit M [Micromonospora sp. ALFpr18c]|uniref:FAD binding domain-containing protein n=1 Tax=unclassified Micromonospora TaxID=2617518 RepID=UPI00124B41F5|nr:xanthine dehydrogenase family protein subunit M [Micromonospora sp. ALFpr18c]KAB1942463.1 xanthine dehydrogenase family protein subunit M [Micromonospora sp. ALFpr18c]
MKPFRYHRPADVADAVAVLAAEPQAAYLAGGTNLVDLMKLGVQRPDVLVDVNRLPLDTVEELPDGGLRIGATVRNSHLAAHPTVRRDYPVLTRALLAAASGQLRNMATTGGNLLQRTRCPYFQDTSKACNKRDPGSGCAALHGVNRDLAVLDWSEQCVATNPSDMAVALAVLDAVVEVHDTDGVRDVPLADLYRSPGAHPERETTLARGALITAVRLPALPAARRSTYLKARDRASFAFAAGSVAAVLDLDGDVIRDVRLAYGALAHRPWRAYRAEQELRGHPFSPELVARAADAELAEARPLSENGFKLPLTRSITVRVLSGLAGRAQS